MKYKETREEWANRFLRWLDDSEYKPYHKKNSEVEDEELFIKDLLAKQDKPVSDTNFKKWFKEYLVDSKNMADKINESYIKSFSPTKDTNKTSLEDKIEHCVECGGIGYDFHLFTCSKFKQEPVVPEKLLKVGGNDYQCGGYTIENVGNKINSIIDYLTLIKKNSK